MTRENWDIISTIGTNVIVYNCTPVENIQVNTSRFIDCIVTTKTGRELASIQASHQFKLYTGLEFPL